jgi:hypothetical protein
MDLEGENIVSPVQDHAYAHAADKWLCASIARYAMQDLTMLFFTAVFFGLAFLYVKACQKLR